jgi:hypothetical protein
MSTYILIVDDEPDVEGLFRQHFRRDLRSGRFMMEFALIGDRPRDHKSRALPED